MLEYSKILLIKDGFLKVFIFLTAELIVSRNAEIEDLLCKISRGTNKREAFAKLYELIKTDVYAFALSRMGNEADAEDVTEDCFVRIYRFAEQYKPKGKPMAWIFTIAINVMKRHRVLKSRHLSYDDEICDSLADDSESPEICAVNRDLVGTLLSVLSGVERDIVIMHAVSGVKHREIAKLLQLPLSTVLSRYNRAIKKLREKAEKGGVL